MSWSRSASELALARRPLYRRPGRLGLGPDLEQVCAAAGRTAAARCCPGPALTTGHAILADRALNQLVDLHPPGGMAIALRDTVDQVQAVQRRQRELGFQLIDMPACLTALGQPGTGGLADEQLLRNTCGSIENGRQLQHGPGQPAGVLVGLLDGDVPQRSHRTASSATWYGGSEPLESQPAIRKQTPVTAALQETL